MIKVFGKNKGVDIMQNLKYQDLSIEDLRKLFFATAIIGAQAGFYSEKEARAACHIFEVFAKTLQDPELIELGLDATGEIDFNDAMN